MLSSCVGFSLLANAICFFFLVMDLIQVYLLNPSGDQTLFRFSQLYCCLLLHFSKSLEYLAYSYQSNRVNQPLKNCIIDNV